MESMGMEEIRSRSISISYAVFFLIALFGHKGFAFTKVDMNINRKIIALSLSLNSNENQSTWILLAEGEQSLRNKMGEYIANEGGHIVTGVADATSAVLVCRGTVRPKKISLGNSTRYPDCLVLDAQLPGTINGLDVLKLIRRDASLKFLPVILIGERERVNGYDGEPDAYLKKPFDPDELLSVIDSVTKRSSFTVRSMPKRDDNTNSSVLTADELRQELSEIKCLLVKSGFNLKNIFNTTDDTNIGSIHQDLREIEQSVRNRFNQEKPTAKHTKNVTSQGEFLVDIFIFMKIMHISQRRLIN